MSDLNELQDLGLRWYIAHTYSGYENKVKASLEKIIENRDLGHLIHDIKVPSETVIEQNGDKVKEIEVKIFPSYVFVKMIMTDESWHAVRNITGVTGFVGPGSRPAPLSEQEVLDANLESTEEISAEARLGFGVGDEVTVVAGDLFVGLCGVVQSISEDHEEARVLINGTRRPVIIRSECLKLKA